MGRNGGALLHCRRRGVLEKVEYSDYACELVIYPCIRINPAPAQSITTMTKNKTPRGHCPRGVCYTYGVAVTYFRMRMHTIIGANPFHGPVRDGKAWVQVAIAAT